MDLTALLSAPHHLSVDLGAGWRSAAGSGVAIDTVATAAGLRVVVGAPTVEVCAVRMRWCVAVPEGTRCLGDAWERGYGDLEWRGLVPERIMPWYALLHDGALHGVGVATGGGSFASWQVDEVGITLLLDLRNGGSGVRLGARRLDAATVVVRQGKQGEDAFAAAHAFCKALCSAPRLPTAPVYGVNDWYYAYSHNTADTVRRDGAMVAELTAGLANRPFMVIDAGWSGRHGCPGGPWTANAKFPDMPALAKDLSALGVKPGLWVRPLLHDPGVDARWTLQAPRHVQDPGEVVLDPSVPEVLALATGLLRTTTGWGYSLVKHDFSTFDICGRWGFDMANGRPTADGWRFRDDSRTTAEIIVGLYRAIRAGAGDALVLGCNTVGHLSAGLFEVSRTGDDTSGKHWERTRRMGINTLAMRMPQHDAFCAVDADCVGLTNQVPWELNRQWLNVLSRSGTPLFVSPDPAALDGEKRAALRDAFAIASKPRAASKPLDWMHTTQPSRWLHADGEATYRWASPEGASSPCPG